MASDQTLEYVVCLERRAQLALALKRVRAGSHLVEDELDQFLSCQALPVRRGRRRRSPSILRATTGSLLGSSSWSRAGSRVRGKLQPLGDRAQLGRKPLLEIVSACRVPEKRGQQLVRSSDSESR
jgi:hypothetical protein